ncbi:MAG: hypothetical protein KDA41_10610 [Planctomycetales bacterium]|nr:hypothetical protein [Planctomycetales bacterium]
MKHDNRHRFRADAARLAAACFAVMLAAFGVSGARAHGAAPCRIELVEKGSGWPVPLVELRTTHGVRLVSDNAGVIAFDLPELMGQPVWFSVFGHGYSVPADGFGQRGVRLTPRPGATLRVELTRSIVARRLGRLTGAGLLAESQKLGEFPDQRESGVVGRDSVQVAPHGGKLFWLWGDTTLARYPLGIFHTTAATTAAAPLSSFKPPLHFTFEHFSDDESRPVAIAKLPGDGPTWLTGLASVRDDDGAEHLVATYCKVTPPLAANHWGLCAWNNERRQFESVRVLWDKQSGGPTPPPLPKGHAVSWRDEQGEAWLLFGDPLPTLRMPATWAAWNDPARWEILKPQATLRAAADGAAVEPHSGSIAWNAYRKRWVTVFMQRFGKPSAFGELWYAEAASPAGPWGAAAKVLSHDNYTFYNPRLHPELVAAPDSPVLLFEGTYTQQFADRPVATPRYDYNQILYRLDLDDPALRPAQAAEQ